MLKLLHGDFQTGVEEIIDKGTKQYTVPLTLKVSLSSSSASGLLISESLWGSLAVGDVAVAIK